MSPSFYFFRNSLIPSTVFVCLFVCGCFILFLEGELWSWGFFSFVFLLNNLNFHFFFSFTTQLLSIVFPSFLLLHQETMLSKDCNLISCIFLTLPCNRCSDLTGHFLIAYVSSELSPSDSCCEAISSPSLALHFSLPHGFSLSGLYLPQTQQKHEHSLTGIRCFFIFY